MVGNDPNPIGVVTVRPFREFEDWWCCSFSVGARAVLFTQENDITPLGLQHFLFPSQGSR